MVVLKYINQFFLFNFVVLLKLTCITPILKLTVYVVESPSNSANFLLIIPNVFTASVVLLSI